MIKSSKSALRVLSVVSIAMAMMVLNRSGLLSQEKPAAKKETGLKVDKNISDFMRKKLDASNQVLEGLVTEDAELLKKGADALAEMSKAEKWMVSKDVMYRQFSGEFQRAVEKLSEAAKDEKFDQASLRWIDSTMKCIECHKFVRGIRLAGQ